MCANPCPTGTYHIDCTKKCDCFNGAVCDHVNGKCHCLPGFKGDKVGGDLYFYFDLLVLGLFSGA